MMLEHMRSDNQLMGVVMDILNPLTVGLWGQILIERRKTIERSGLKLKQIMLNGICFRELALSQK